MNYIEFLNVTKNLDIIIYDDHISIWSECNKSYDNSKFFDWIKQCMYVGFDYIDDKLGETYFICLRCRNCNDRFCYKRGL